MFTYKKKPHIKFSPYAPNFVELARPNAQASISIRVTKKQNREFGVHS